VIHAPGQLERPGAVAAVPAIAVSTWRRLAIAASGLAATGIMALPASPIGQYFSLPAQLTDYGTHAQRAAELLEGGIAFPHFLWHAVVVAAHAVAPWLDWMEAARVIVVLSYGLQGVVLAWVITTMVAAPRHGFHTLCIVLLTLLVVTAAPVTVFNWRDGGLYYGYLNMESYASPTQALLKPLALLAFALTLRGFAARAGDLRSGLALGTVVVLSALAKPSFLICLVPAVVVLGGTRRLTGQAVHLVYLVGGCIVPSIGVLAWQYLAYFAPGGSSSIVVAPLLVMGYYSDWLAPKFLMSILLPSTVVLAYAREALADSTLRLAWLLFVFAAAYTYLLAETREPLAGNFAWAGQIGTYLLFVTSTVFALRRWTPGWRSAACALAFGLHAASGVFFYLFPMTWGTLPAR
jgi:hypothetical protein